MHNQHNAIAKRIDTIRKKWIAKSEKYPDWQIARWLILPDDADLYTGFLKLESSQHGNLPEMFVVMLTAFENPLSFTKHLIKDWLETFRKEQEKHPELVWEYTVFEEQLAGIAEIEKARNLLLEMFEDFRNMLLEEKRTLIVSLIPRTVSDFSSYNNWLIELYQIGIPDRIKFMLLDHTPYRYLEKTCKNTYPNSFTIPLEDMNMKGAIQELATQGDPSDPQIGFRKCFFEMGNALAKNEPGKVQFWGEKILQITQQSGDRNFYASAHLIYAGFQLHFKDNSKAKQLLEKGIRIAKAAQEYNPASGGTLMQLYSYMGAYYSINKEYRQAIRYFVKQADTAVAIQLPQMAIGAYKMGIYLADTQKLKDDYLQLIEDAYKIGMYIPDEELRATEYAYICHHYIKTFEKTKPDVVQELEERMEKLYGKDWQNQLETILEQAIAKKPISPYDATYQ